MSNSNSNNNNPITNNNLFSAFPNLQDGKAEKERKKARKTLRRMKRGNRETKIRRKLPLPPEVRSHTTSFLNSRNARALASTSKAMRNVAEYNNRIPKYSRPITVAGRERRQFKSLPLPKEVSTAITSYLKPSNLQSLEATGKTFGNTVSYNTTRRRKRAARAKQPVAMTELAARGNVEAKRDFRPFPRSYYSGYNTPSGVSLGRYMSPMLRRTETLEAADGALPFANDGDWEDGLYTRLKRTEGPNHMMSIDLDKDTLFSRGYRPVPGRRHQPGNTPLQSAVSNAEEAVHRNPQYYRKPLLRQSAMRAEILSNKNLHRERMEHPLASIKRFRMPSTAENSDENGGGGGESKKPKKTKKKNKKGGRKTRKRRRRRKK